MKKEVLAFILMIISLICIVFFKSFIGTIFAIITLIITLTNLKSKKALNTIALVGSIVIILFSVIAFITSYKVVNNIKSNTQTQVMKTSEDYLEISVKNYTDEYIEDGTFVNGENIVNKQLLDKYNIGVSIDCDYYVVANVDLDNESNNTYKAYLKCDNYTTDGYDDTLTK